MTGISKKRNVCLHYQGKILVGLLHQPNYTFLHMFEHLGKGI